jgi:DNA-binding NtrC family response regulator
LRPVGSSKKIKVDVRLVTASNRDLSQMAREGKFRQDLLFRINGVTIKLPPLRDRKGDLPLLTDHLIQRLARASNVPPSALADDALPLILKWDWPGNIRELESVLRNALFLAKGQQITRRIFQTHADLFPFLRAVPQKPVPVDSATSDEQSAERRVLIEALRRHGMDKKAAAAELDISLRNFYTRLERCGIPKKKTVLAAFLGLR